LTDPDLLDSLPPGLMPSQSAAFTGRMNELLDTAMSSDNADTLAATKNAAYELIQEALLGSDYVTIGTTGNVNFIPDGQRESAAVGMRSVDSPTY